MTQAGSQRREKRSRRLYGLHNALVCSELTSSQGVYIGSGIGSLDDVYDTTVAYEKGVSLVAHSYGNSRRLTLPRVTEKCHPCLFLDC